MHKFLAYPVITTAHFPETVAFYEDMFGFVPFYEADGYARLCHKDDQAAMMVIIKADSELLPPDLRHEGRGQILSVATDDIDATYDALYHEGLEIIKEPTELDAGIRHFMVADPNNAVVISVVTPPPCVTDCGCKAAC